MKSSTLHPRISSSGYPKRRSKAGLQSWTLLFESSTTLASGLFSTMAVRKALRSLIVPPVRSRFSNWLSAGMPVIIAGVVISGESCPPFRDADLPFLRLVRAESTLIGIEFFMKAGCGANFAHKLVLSLRARLRKTIYKLDLQKPTPNELFSACRGGTSIVRRYHEVPFREQFIPAGGTNRAFSVSPIPLARF